MRGRKTAQTNFVTLVNIEERIPRTHPIREVKRMIGEVFRRLDSHFEALYADKGRDSVPPERLLAAKVLMALYSVRSERQFCERLKYDLLSFNSSWISILTSLTRSLTRVSSVRTKNVCWGTRRRMSSLPPSWRSRWNGAG